MCWGFASKDFICNAKTNWKNPDDYYALGVLWFDSRLYFVIFNLSMD